MLPVPNLRRLRLERFVTQDELAARAGVGSATIHRLENGSPARLSTIRKLAGALDVEPSQLTSSSEQEPGQSSAAA